MTEITPTYLSIVVDFKFFVFNQPLYIYKGQKALNVSVIRRFYYSGYRHVCVLGYFESCVLISRGPDAKIHGHQPRQLRHVYFINIITRPFWWSKLLGGSVKQSANSVHNALAEQDEFSSVLRYHMVSSTRRPMTTGNFDHQNGG